MVGVPLSVRYALRSATDGGTLSVGRESPPPRRGQLRHDYVATGFGQVGGITAHPLTLRGLPLKCPLPPHPFFQFVFIFIINLVLQSTHALGIYSFLHLASQNPLPPLPLTPSPP